MINKKNIKLIHNKISDEKHDSIQKYMILGYIILIIFTLLLLFAIRVGSFKRALIYIIIMITPIFIFLVIKYKLHLILFQIINSKPTSEFHQFINLILLLIFIICILLWFKYRSIRPIIIFIISLIILSKIHPIIYLYRDKINSKFITYDHIILPTIIFAFALSIILTIKRTIKRR